MRHVYIPRPARRSIWPTIVGVVTFAAFQAAIIALMVLARAILGGGA